MGTEYISQCTCGIIIYDIKGYQLTKDVGNREGMKAPLPPENLHPKWIRVTGRTFISRQFTAEYETAHQSFEGLASAHNSMLLSGMGQEAVIFRK